MERGPAGARGAPEGPARLEARPAGGPGFRTRRCSRPGNGGAGPQAAHPQACRLGGGPGFRTRRSSRPGSGGAGPQAAHPQAGRHGGGPGFRPRRGTRPGSGGAGPQAAHPQAGEHGGGDCPGSDCHRSGPQAAHPQAGRYGGGPRFRTRRGTRPGSGGAGPQAAHSQGRVHRGLLTSGPRPRRLRPCRPRAPALVRLPTSRRARGRGLGCASPAIAGLPRAVSRPPWASSSG